jgi:hypothetical protein
MAANKYISIAPDKQQVLTGYDQKTKEWIRNFTIGVDFAPLGKYKWTIEFGFPIDPVAGPLVVPKPELQIVVANRPSPVEDLYTQFACRNHDDPRKADGYSQGWFAYAQVKAGDKWANIDTPTPVVVVGAPAAPAGSPVTLTPGQLLAGLRENQALASWLYGQYTLNLLCTAS